jgi:hypothetical protein
MKSTSAISNRATSVLMFTVVKMRKEEKLSFGTSTMVTIRNGKLSTKKMLKRFKTRDL